MPATSGLCKVMPAADRPRHGGQLDICALDDGGRIGFEAIAPGPCDGEDGMRGPPPFNRGGRFDRVPTRQAQLRTSGVLWQKTRVFERYLRQCADDSEDVRIVAIGGGSFGMYATEHFLPLISPRPCSDRRCLRHARPGHEREVVGGG